MNLHQRYNHSKIHKLLKEKLLIKRIVVKSNSTIDVETENWEEYWKMNSLLSNELLNLKMSWLSLLESCYNPSQYKQFVKSYFDLLNSSLLHALKAELKPSCLRRVVGFGSFS